MVKIILEWEAFVRSLSRAEMLTEDAELEETQKSALRQAGIQLSVKASCLPHISING